MYADLTLPAVEKLFPIDPRLGRKLFLFFLAKIPFLRSDPDVRNTGIDGDKDLLILASDGLWKVMSNQEAVDIARKVKDPLKAAKLLTLAALTRECKDDISCIVPCVHV